MADDQRSPAPLKALYDEDFYVWVQNQVEAILAAARDGSLPSKIDWERLADEVGDLGRSELRAAQSLAQRIIEHLYLLAATKRDEPKAHWRQEIRVFRSYLEDAFTPTTRKLVAEDLDRLHRRAAKLMVGKMELEEPVALPLDASLRWTLAQILGEENDPIG